MKYYPLEDVYLCGRDVTAELLDGIRRIGTWAGHGFCYELAAFGMLAIGDEVESRLVQGVNNQVNCHCWVEIEYQDNEWVLDLAWNRHLELVPREKYYQEFAPVPYWQCERSDFWRLEAANVLHDRIQRADTSFILKELKWFRPSCQLDSYMDLGFQPYIPEYDASTGRRFRTFRHARQYIGPQIFKEFMRDSRVSAPSRFAIEVDGVDIETARARINKEGLDPKKVASHSIGVLSYA